MNCIRIERLMNGYTVEVTDPKIQAANQKPNSRWKDPNKEYAFKDLKSACKWIMENEAMMTTEDSDAAAEFTGAWNKAKSEDD